MKGSKFLSILLSLIMVITLLPMDSVKVHADSDRRECINCNEWTDEYCTNCAGDHYCVCSSCEELWHCALCGGCYLNCDAEPCCDKCNSAICVDCAESEGYHCPDCHECFQGDEDMLCGNCFRCPNCVDTDICEVCGWCHECQSHCPLCDSCDYEDEKCEEDGEHCTQCCIECENCEECMLAKEQEPCEFCGLCEDCCVDNSCDACGMCAENPEYEDHKCAECDACFESGIDQCETCGLCEDCCQAAAAEQGCECGQFCQDEVSDNHICDNCGECFGITNYSEEAEAEGYCLCEDCYAEVKEIEEAGGEHNAKAKKTWSYNATHHWKDCMFCEDESHVTSKAAHNFSANGICRTCGFKDGSKIYITKQPMKKILNAKKDGEDGEKAYLNVTARGKANLFYEWQYKKDGVFVLFKNNEAIGYKGPSLIYTVKEGDCHDIMGTGKDRVIVRCRVTDGIHEVYTNEVPIIVRHTYDTKREVKNNDESHWYLCDDKTCNSCSKDIKHTYSTWTWNEDRTERKAKCKDCGYEKTYHKHSHDINGWSEFADEYNQWTLTNEATNEYTIEVDGYEYIIDERHHEGYCDVEGIDECGVYINEAHDWNPWWPVSATPLSKGERGGMHRTCKICEYDEDRVQKDKDGNPIYWEFGTHPVSVVGGSMDNSYGLVKDEETIHLTPEKKENYTFNGWKIEYEKLQTKNGSSYYDTVSGMVTYDEPNIEFLRYMFKLSDDLKTFTMSNVNDAGKWTFTAQYKEGCNHKKTEISGQMEATCGHVGYTGDTVCSECGKVMKSGEEIDKLEHKHTHMVEESKVVLDYKGDVVYRNKQPVYIYRKHELGDCVKHVKSYSGDIICDDCKKVVERGHVGTPEHDWEILNVIEKATNKKKGKNHCKCKKCGIEKDVVTDYTGPDYSVAPSRKEIAFNLEFGKKPQPVVIDFRRIGRNAKDIEKIVGVEYKLENTVDLKITGDMQITITPKMVNYGVFEKENYIDVEFLTKDGKKVWLHNQIPSQDEYIHVEMNILKSKEKYTLTVLNGDIMEGDGKNRKFYSTPRQYRAGEETYVVAPNEEIAGKFGNDCFIEWEVVSDESGIVKDYLTEVFGDDAQDDGFSLMMPNNDVVIRAKIKHEHDYEFTKTVVPTCTEEGYDLYSCKYGSETIKKNVKPALGHAWDNGKVTKKATKNAEGIKTYTCKHCHKTRTEKIAKLKTGSAASVKNLKKVKLRKLKAKKKAVNVTWKKLKGVDGYQIQYSLNKKFKKGKKFNTKKKLVKGGKLSKKLVKKLKSKKIYYVRIRAYVVVNGKKKFGVWSNKKKVKIK